MRVIRVIRAVRGWDSNQLILCFDKAQTARSKFDVWFCFVLYLFCFCFYAFAFVYLFVDFCFRMYIFTQF